MRKRLRDLIRDRERLRKHNRMLINLYAHYFEMTHHSSAQKRAEKLRPRSISPTMALRVSAPVETNEEFVNRLKGKR